MTFVLILYDTMDGGQVCWLYKLLLINSHSLLLNLCKELIKGETKWPVFHLQPVFK